MSRRPRLHVPGAYYHVTLRGNHRKNIFFRPADRRRLDEIMAEALEHTQTHLHAYCWMSNHVHLSRTNCAYSAMIDFLHDFIFHPACLVLPSHSNNLPVPYARNSKSRSNKFSPPRKHVRSQKLAG